MSSGRIVQIIGAVIDVVFGLAPVSTEVPLLAAATGATAPADTCGVAGGVWFR